MTTRRNHKFQIVEKKPTRGDDWNRQPEGYAIVGSVYFNLTHTSSDEVLENGQMVGSNFYNADTHYRQDLRHGTTLRSMQDGLIYNVEGVRDRDGRKRELTCRLSRRNAG